VLDLEHVANTTEPSVCGGDVALCQVTLTTCYVVLLLCYNIALRLGKHYSF